MVLVARLRSWLVRHPRIVWSAAVLAAVVTAWGVLDALASLDAARRQWGQTVTVWVASRDLAPGDPVEAVPRAHPRAVVATDVLGRDPTGLVAIQHLGAGETLMAADVGRSGLELLPVDWRGVAVDVDGGALGLAPGSRVDVVAAGQMLAEDAVVVAVAETSLVVGVPRQVAPAVADAAGRGEVGVVLRPD